jgi:hypothetical protein
MMINITPQDFELLRENDMSWADILRISAGGPDRFELVMKWATGDRLDEDYPWKRIYWFGREYTAVLLAQVFLKNMGQQYAVLWDLAAEWEKPAFGYAILTDYEREK